MTDYSDYKERDLYQTLDRMEGYRDGLQAAKQACQELSHPAQIDEWLDAALAETGKELEQIQAALNGSE